MAGPLEVTVNPMRRLTPGEEAEIAWMRQNGVLPATGPREGGLMQMIGGILSDPAGAASSAYNAVTSDPVGVASGILGSAYEGISTPLQVYRGQKQMTDAQGRILPERIGEAFDIAGTLGSGTLAKTAVRGGQGSNVVGMMGGGEANPNRISTRFPTAAKATEDPLRDQLSIGLPEFQNSSVFEYNTGLLSEYPGMSKMKGATPDEAINMYVDQSADNLRYLYDSVPAATRERSKQWYVGANRITNAIAERYGLPAQSVAGVMAALSPQKDWFQNASLGERLTDIVVGRSDVPMSSEMATTQQRIFGKPQYQEMFNAINGKKLSEITDPLQRAMWVRLYDEAHNPRSYRIVGPEGDYGDFATGKSGEQGSVAWGSLGEIAKGVSSLDSGGDISRISTLMGERHKVRNFFNNIIDPFGKFGDVTSDTHAVAANLLLPLSGNTAEVSHGLGSSLAKKHQPEGYRAAKGTAIEGVYGTYGPNAEAYRRAADSRGILPREMQSITWEALRGLFSPSFKGNKKNVAAARSVWEKYDAGQISADEARRAIVELAGGIERPAWERGNSPVYDPKRYSTYQRELR